VIKQRIGIVLHDDGAGGGSERIARRLGQAWMSAGRDVVLLVGDPTGWRELPGTIPRRLSPQVPIERATGSRRRLGRWAGEAAREERLDALYLPGNFHLAALPALRRAAAGWPLAIVALLSNPVERRDRRGLARAVWRARTRRRLAQADRMVALSQALAEEARPLVAAGGLSVIPLPVLDDDTPVRPRAPGPRTTLVLGVGRLVPQKNWPLLLRAVALCAPAVRLRLVGEGPERSRLERLAAELGLAERVVFAGRVDDVPAAKASAGLLAIASDYETGPAVALEALAAGLPVVATACSPSIDELVPPGHGIIVPTGDAEALAQAITTTLADPPPPVSPAHLDRFRIGGVARAFLALFDGV